MSQWKRIVCICMLALMAGSSINVPAMGHKTLPTDVYHRAWQLVRDNYYDSNYNGRNWLELEHKFDSQIKTTADAHKYVKVMLESLSDPYTRFLDPRAFQDENDAIDARIVGIGINLMQSKDQQRLIINRVIEGGPAEQSGVQSGDEIASIDGINAIGMTPEQAADHIRGKANTAVVLGLRHGNTSHSVNIVRQEIVIHAVSSRLDKATNIGYINLSTFISNDAADEFKAALQKLSKADGLIIDLRDNPGGLLSNALEIADMLLEGGAIVSTISRHGRHTDIASGEPLSHQPIVLLVDNESASASEILASALKDNGRAVVIGEKTYGKGLVQEINRLPGGAAVHITVSRYLTPSGSDINKVGVIPDITVADKKEQERVAKECIREKIASLKPLRTSSLTLTK
ncbi:MAG: S41 family peptidase [Candidatus Obscuribacter sp.]|nr:S41 family peptidase [Candidatus Obscuribacter sp.]MBP6348910.1 S41 family peptidase [Candidatus Obscuribacter sp.]MBP6593015.1 S41 family peptidase [Candidatus Obscuribacter sp.]MBP7576357.1 S41 family peptidase [Candidatus Obscuribacter sp.]